MVIGLIGAVLPILPSIPIVYAGYVVYGFATDWQHYGWGVMVVFGAVTVFSLVADYVTGAMGAQRYGASRAGIWGSIIGGIVGVVIFNLIGLILGIILGAILGELILGKSIQEAVRAGWGAFLGFLAGTLFKIMVAVIMIGVFVWLIAV